jgi:hypothetical protein
MHGLSQRSYFIGVIFLLIIAACFRIAVAHWLPNDAPDDGKTYARIARNVLEQHAYSNDEAQPYAPTLIRLPGYPLFLAGIYKVFGHQNNGAVRIVQALVDTATCGLIALLAFYWEPDDSKKRTTAAAALALAAVCPFTTIYAATILTEVPVIFLTMAMCLAATLAFRSANFQRALRWWALAGLLGGLAVLFRPDSGLFVAAIGLTIVVAGLSRVRSSALKRSPSADAGRLKAVLQTIAAGAVLSLGFVLVLVPWTIRNQRVFHLFQPLAPAHGEMPDEFVPRGYELWLRSWVDDDRYIAPLLWSLDSEPIDLDEIPPEAFDSAQEKARVATLLEKYNHADGVPGPDASPVPQSRQPNATPAPQSSPAKPVPGPSNQPTKPPANSNANSNSEDTGDEGDQNDNSSDSGDESDDESEKSNPEDQAAVEMTPDIDAEFGVIARERIARHPLRFYLVLPFKRAHTMWIDTHSQYWPFEGALLPLDDLDYKGHQQYWLPLFAALTAGYTLLGLVGAWLLWKSRKSAARRWLLLAALFIILRLGFFSTLENPEPRYVVEFFPVLAALGGIAVSHGFRRVRPRIEQPVNSES